MLSAVTRHAASVKAERVTPSRSIAATAGPSISSISSRFSIGDLLSGRLEFELLDQRDERRLGQRLLLLCRLCPVVETLRLRVTPRFDDPFQQPRWRVLPLLQRDRGQAVE